MLFNVVINSIMSKVTPKPRGITWYLNVRLEDLDYADDICLLSHRYTYMQSKLTGIAVEEANYGLKINIPKTKSMKANTRSLEPFSLHQQNVESFCYLVSVITATGGALMERSSLRLQLTGSLPKLVPLPNKINKYSGL